ncbi:MAG: hypothetical protein ACREFE_19975 [Limisphaerales bacterium]
MKQNPIMVRHEIFDRYFSVSDVGRAMSNGDTFTDKITAGMRLFGRSRQMSGRPQIKSGLTKSFRNIFPMR